MVPPAHVGTRKMCACGNDGRRSGLAHLIDNLPVTQQEVLSPSRQRFAEVLRKQWFEVRIRFGVHRAFFTEESFDELLWRWPVPSWVRLQVPCAATLYYKVIDGKSHEIVQNSFGPILYDFQEGANGFVEAPDLLRKEE